MNFRKHLSKGGLGLGEIDASSDRVFAVVFGVVMA
jgi:hypothetical protein